MRQQLEVQNTQLREQMEVLKKEYYTLEVQNREGRAAERPQVLLAGEAHRRTAVRERPVRVLGDDSAARHILKAPEAGWAPRAVNDALTSEERRRGVGRARAVGEGTRWREGVAKPNPSCHLLEVELS